MLIKLYFITLPILLVFDGIWLGIISKNFYAKYLGYLMKTNANLSAAILFYLIFAFGLCFFVISPALEKKLWLNALLSGALFGLVAYATYDLTNLATIKDWPIIVTIVDLIWGATISALVCVISYIIARKLGL